MLLAAVTDLRPLVAVAVKALANRTPEQVVARAQRRWDLHGHAARWYAGEVHSPIGVAISLLEPGRCPDPRCDDRTNVDTGQPCVRCLEGQEDFMRERRQRRAPDGPAPSRAVPAARQPEDDTAYAASLAKAPECADCKRPTRRLSAAGRCSDCEDAHLAIQRAIGGDDPVDA